MDLDWNDLKYFISVARLGGLSAATDKTGVSAATLGRRVAELERQIGEPLFERKQTGYRLTPAGEQLLHRAEEAEAAVTSIRDWREGKAEGRLVRVSAGTWTSQFIANHIGDIWHAHDPFRVELVTAYARIDIGRRNADIGIRSARPQDLGLAGRRLPDVAYALYAGRQLINGVEAGLFVGITGEGADLQSSRWLMAHHGDRIGVRGNNARSVRDLVAAGAGLSVFPCFAGDSDPQLVRVAQPIAELKSEQWLVTHHEERHDPQVHKVADRIAELIRSHRTVFSATGEP